VRRARPREAVFCRGARGRTVIVRAR
jgi:hypothetical protein